MSWSICSGSRTTFTLSKVELKCANSEPLISLALLWPDFNRHHERLQMDTHFLCSDQRMDTELVDKLVLQLNRIYPQILNDKEAYRVTTICIWRCCDRWIAQSLSWSGSSSHVCSCSSGTWVFPPKCVWQSCWNTSVGRARRRVKSSTEDSTFKPRMSTPACQQGSYREVGLSILSQSLKWLKTVKSNHFCLRREHTFLI